MREWGVQLWDCFEKVDSGMNDRINKNEKTLKFLREKSSIDIEYSKNLKRLVKRYQTDNKEFSIDQSFSELVSQTNDVANQYEQIAEQIVTDSIMSLNSFNQEIIASRKEYQNEHKRLCNNLDSMEKDVEKAKNVWERKCRDYDKAKQQFEKADADLNVTKADVEKSRHNSHQKRQNAEDAKNEYANRLVKYNEQQKNHHQDLVPAILNNYQTIFLKNVDHYQASITKFCESEERFFPLIEKCISELKQKNKSNFDGGIINKEFDSEHIIDTVKTGYTPPEDKAFEDMELEAHNPPKAKPKRQIFTGFLKMKTEKPVQEDMSHLPPQQRKRQLEKLKKENDKNIAKEQNDIAALKKMANVDNFGDSGKLQENINQLQSNLKDLRMQEEKLNLWLGQSGSTVSTKSPPSTRNLPCKPIVPKTLESCNVPGIPTRINSFDTDYDENDDFVYADCLYDFHEEGDECISITQGMILILLEEDTGDGWTKVRSTTTLIEGFVPTSYIQIKS